MAGRAPLLEEGARPGWRPPTIDALPDGRHAIAWSERGEGGRDLWRGQRFATDGAPRGDAEVLHVGVESLRVRYTPEERIELAYVAQEDRALRLERPQAAGVEIELGEDWAWRTEARWVAGELTAAVVDERFVEDWEGCAPPPRRSSTLRVGRLDGASLAWTELGPFDGEGELTGLGLHGSVGQAITAVFAHEGRLYVSILD